MLRTDYLIIGSGAFGMAFADQPERIRERLREARPRAEANLARLVAELG